MLQNRYGHTMEMTEIKSIDKTGDWYHINLVSSWSFGVSEDECGDFVPRVGDYVVLGFTRGSLITELIIEGRVIRRKTAKQVEDDRKQFSNDLRLKRLEEYVANHEKMQERLEALHPALKARMMRFGEEGGQDFWIEDAGYEMYGCEGANALLNKTEELFPDPPRRSAITGKFATSADKAKVVEKRIQWIEDWWKINSKEHDPPYDYKKQMELVPDFGDEHSGNTAAAAKALAVWILKGKEV